MACSKLLLLLRFLFNFFVFLLNLCSSIVKKRNIHYFLIRFFLFKKASRNIGWIRNPHPKIRNPQKKQEFAIDGLFRNYFWRVFVRIMNPTQKLGGLPILLRTHTLTENTRKEWPPAQIFKAKSNRKNEGIVGL